MRRSRFACRAIALGLAAVGLTPAGALAAPCQPRPDRPTAEVWVEDRSSLQDEAMPLAQRRAPLPLLHAFRVSIVGVDDVNIQAPAGVPFSRDGHDLIVAPKVAGPLVLPATWTEPLGNGRCEDSSNITLQIAPLTERPRVRFTKFSAIDRPQLEFIVRIARGPLGDAGPIAIRARVGTRASAPRGKRKALFTLPLGLPALGAKKPLSGRLAFKRAKLRGFGIVGQSAFDETNFDQIPVPSGGGTGAQVTLDFDGTGRKVRSQFGSFYRRGVLARRGLVLEVVQRGRVLGRLSTGILCVNPGNTVPRCRTPGYRTTG
jgi:hypothetical protein